MPLVYGFSNKSKRTLFYRGFEYIKECDNVGTTSWRCRFNKSLKCKARLVTDEGQTSPGKEIWLSKL
jgi:FLYWCH zinc finger domain